MTKRESKPGSLILKLCLFGMLTGCAAHQAYDGPKLPPERVAQLQISPEGAGAAWILPKVIRIDNREIERYHAWIDALPGKRKLYIDPRFGGDTRPLAELNCELEANKKYMVQLYARAPAGAFSPLDRGSSGGGPGAGVLFLIGVGAYFVTEYPNRKNYEVFLWIWESNPSNVICGMAP